MWNGVKVGLQVDVYGVSVTSFRELVDAAQRIFASPVGAKAVAVGGELSFQNWFQDVT